MRRFVIFLVGIGLFLGIVFNPLLVVSEFDVSSPVFIHPDVLEDYLEPYKGSYMIPLLLGRTLTKGLLSTFPQIQHVHYDLGRRKLGISIQEKAPWAVFLVQNESIPVSRDGTLLLAKGTGTVVDIESLFIIKGIPEDLLRGSFVDQQVIKDVFSVCEMIRASFPDEIFSLEVKDMTRYVLSLNDTLPILIGTSEHLQEKLDALHLYLEAEDVPIERINQIDLRFQDQVIVDVR